MERRSSDEVGWVVVGRFASCIFGVAQARVVVLRLGCIVGRTADSTAGRSCCSPAAAAAERSSGLKGGCNRCTLVGVEEDLKSRMRLVQVLDLGFDTLLDSAGAHTCRRVASSVPVQVVEAVVCCCRMC